MLMTLIIESSGICPNISFGGEIFSYGVFNKCQNTAGFSRESGRDMAVPGEAPVPARRLDHGRQKGLSSKVRL